MRIIPIKTGTIYCNKTVLTYGKGYDEFVRIPSTAWLIEQGKFKILVDTGMCDTERANKYHYKNSKQSRTEKIDIALKAKNIEVDEIDVIIITHLHWDHCSNLSLFKNCTFYLQKKELEYAKKTAIPFYYRSYEIEQAGLTPDYAEIEFELLNGAAQILPGIHVISTPGHSLGHQSVVLEGEQTYVIAGDACLCYQNLEPDEDKNIAFTMIGRYMDVNAAWESLDKINSIADVVLPSHDHTVFRNECYR